MDKKLLYAFLIFAVHATLGCAADKQTGDSGGSPPPSNTNNTNNTTNLPPTNNNNNSTPGTPTTPTAGTSYSYQYQYWVGACDTGNQTVSDSTAQGALDKLCNRLQDNAANNNCALADRQAHFQASCSGRTWSPH